MLPLDSCIMYGPLVAIIVSVLKRIPFVGKHPKVAAAVIVASIAVARVVNPSTPVDVMEIARCVAEQFAMAVASYEVVKSALLNRLR